jgi:para-aminobenzoate synthetase/4-amino-4-deoxychorismate lyase
MTQPDSISPVRGSDVFALLDDADATPATASSRLYTGFVREHRCVGPGDLEAVCDDARDDARRGLHGVLVADYEWGTKLLHAGTQKLTPDDGASLRILMFEKLRRLDAEGAASWLAEREGRPQPAPAGVLGLHAEIDRARFEADIARIHEAIADGETYQVNYTYRMRGRAWGDPVALYRRLRQRQRVNFGALLRLPCGAREGGRAADTVEWVLSRSPELFLRHLGGRLEARPMKGTAPRSSAPEGDSETARMLHVDIKNRAENLMIVDLLRNDLGRIAEPGSVRVPELFRVEPYATVFQMTSTVEATRRCEVGLAELLRALFPCGSITGAPKHRTMHWISRLEDSARGMYTGALGWLDGTDAASPDLCLSVAIRTLSLGPAVTDGEPAGCGLRPLAMGVGGGIVHDSDAAGEWDETQWKARFLTELDPGVQLIETMRAETSAGIAHLHRHRDRLARSAAVLGFRFDAAAFDALVARTLRTLEAGLAPAGRARLRVALHRDGGLELARQPLAEVAVDASGDVSVLLSDDPLPADRALAVFKTTARQAYDAAIAQARAQGAFDTLLFGPGDELLEGGRSNVFVKLDGRWWTPPVADGVLPGVMRAVLLDDPAWGAAERRITRADLARAQGLVVCNALHGALRARVTTNARPASSESRH